MVWGMALPSGFGEFWPDGDFEYDRKAREGGWYQRLGEYYRAQTPEEQKRLFDYNGSPGIAEHFYGTFPAYKFAKEPGELEKGVPCGPIEPHEMPRSWDLKRTHQKIASLIHTESKILAVDEILKAIIERLEPGVHEFFRVEMRMPKGTVYPVPYYILRIGQYFDAFSRDDSWDGSVKDSVSVPGLIHLNDSRKGILGLAFRKAQFGEAHLWRDRIFQENLLCFSDELIAEIERAGLRIPKHYKMREI